MALPRKHLQAERRVIIQAAVDAIEEDYISNETTARRFGIPSSTLHRRAARVVRVSGRNCTLTKREDDRIIDVIVRYVYEVIPMTLENLHEAIYMVVFKRTPVQRFLLADEFKRNSMHYVRLFRRLHSYRLKVALPTRQEAKRFVAVNAVSIANHFATLKKLIHDNHIPLDVFLIWKK